MLAKKGFTLIELLVVLAIVAILSVVVILTLNPAELLKQARDSNRLSDLSTMKSAISLYLADVSSPNLAANASHLNDYTYCWTSAPAYVPVPTGDTGAAHCGVFSAGGATSNYGTSTTANNRNVNATGWIPVNFTSISSGAPIGNLPVDPVNSSLYYYAYVATSSLTFQLDAVLESTKYTANMSSDGGPNNNAFETGTAAGLAL